MIYVALTTSKLPVDLIVSQEIQSSSPDETSLPRLKIGIAGLLWHTVDISFMKISLLQ